MQHSSPFSSKTRYFPDRESAWAAETRSFVAIALCTCSPCTINVPGPHVSGPHRRPDVDYTTHEVTCKFVRIYSIQFLLRKHLLSTGQATSAGSISSKIIKRATLPS